MPKPIKVKGKDVKTTRIGGRQFNIRYSDAKKSPVGNLDLDIGRNPKYLVCPDYVYSNDGDKHYIGYCDLVRLYNIPPNECINGSRPGSTRGLNLEV